jgi:hypothetical protein
VNRLLLLGVLLCACGQRPGDPCSDDSACGGDLVCLKPPSASNGVCSFPFSGAGARCLSSDDCASGLFCSNDLSTGTRQFDGTCQPAQGSGAPCLRNPDCQAPLECNDAVDGHLGTCG